MRNQVLRTEMLEIFYLHKTIHVVLEMLNWELSIGIPTNIFFDFLSRIDMKHNFLSQNYFRKN